MKGMTLCTISAPGCFGVQAKRAIGVAAPSASVEDVVAGRRRLGVERAQVGKLQRVADVGEQTARR